jgi:GNAT superfamily N-acetyltransferase
MITPLAGGVATYSGAGSPLNKVAGLGFDGSVDASELADVECRFAERRSPVQVELASLADPSVGRLLTSRGYRLVGFENVLGRDLSIGTDGPSVDESDIRIETSDMDDFDIWLDTVVTGFLSPDTEGVASHESFARDALEAVMGDMAMAPSFARYVARRGGKPAGGASMRIDHDVAQLCGASTLPEHRRRGVQAALLARRLSDAAGTGCQVAVVTTQPGSTSQRNAQKRGFELLYTRAVLVLEAAG